MIYHMIGESPYTKKFINFLVRNNKMLNLHEHCFLIYTQENSEFDTRNFANINYRTTTKATGFFRLLKRMSKQDRVIIHGLFNPKLLLFFLMNRRIISQCIWSIWGGDVYFYRTKNRGWKDNVTEWARKIVIPKIPVICGLVKGDYEVISSVYRSNAKYIKSFYPNPIDFSLIQKVETKKKDNKPLIFLVGNSGAPTNNHFEIIDIMAEFINENIEVIIPLSYGDTQYIDKVIRYGVEKLGEKFKPLMEFMSPDQYIDILATIDVAIMNHNRQQGLGNILALLALKKKVYIRSDTTPYQFFTENGVVIFDTYDLSRLKLEEIGSVNEVEMECNAKEVEFLISEESCLKGWQEVFSCPI